MEIYIKDLCILLIGDVGDTYFALAMRIGVSHGRNSLDSSDHRHLDLLFVQFEDVKGPEGRAAEGQEAARRGFDRAE